jgi:deoxyribodipyrimidine photolyase-related protein
MPSTLRLILGDQLSDNLSSLRDLDPAHDTVLMAEVREEANYVRHHKQKIALIFSAMRQFAEGLRRRGVTVRYVGYENAENSGSLLGEVTRALGAGNFARVIVTEPGEWRLREAFDAYAAQSAIPFIIRDDTRFICSHARFREWAHGKQTLRMEFFYRMMRAHTGLLMDGDAPAGGQWNYDKENRKRLPRNVTPPPHRFIPPNATTRQAIPDVARLFPDNFGTLDAFGFATNAEEAEQIVADFIDNILPGFGDYQDAMARGEPWMWHSVISAAINCGLIDPLDICRRAEAAYREGRAPLNAVEGFIRQIIGWREFMRGVYWLYMPEYKAMNALGATRALPWFYWSGEARSACLRDCITGTRDHAYAHHIQRLMVTGNFAMLLGVAPAEINDWYMVVYADAYEWVELPNTHGMATFADGGIVGSKPYAASGAYINRMSDYCGTCTYDVRKRTGDDACPFNVLYWDFLMRHEDKLAGNQRIGFAYKNLGRWSEEEKRAIRNDAERLRTEWGV